MAIKITIRLKLIPRFKAIGLEGYRKNKACRTRVECRTNDDDWLTVWDKDIVIQDKLRTIIHTNEEVSRLQKTTNIIIKHEPDFGDMYVGYIKVLGSSDYYMPCFINVRKLKP